MTTVEPATLGRQGMQVAPEGERKALSVFEKACGGREKLVEHLNHSALTGEQEYLVSMIADPANEKKSLATIAKIAKVPFGQVIKFFQDAGFAKAHLAASRKIWKRLPAVAEDVMAKAVARDLTCPECVGVGELTYYTKPSGWKKGDPLDSEVKACWKCQGLKTVRVEPEHEVQKTALEIGGLLKRGVQVGVNVGVQTNNSFAMLGVDHLKNFRAASDRILFPSRRGQGAPEGETVDAEVVPTQSEAAE